MSNPVNIPQECGSPTADSKSLVVPGSVSPVSFSPTRHFNIPSPIITKRTRTYSASERAASNPTQHGKVKYFCRERGHGFITPDEGPDNLFFHISDIDGEFVPKPGDEVSFKKCLVPPKNEKLQAVHVVITHLSPGTHERWDRAPGSPAVEEFLP